MKFTKADSVIGGATHAPSNFEDLSWWDETYITRKTFLRPTLTQAPDYSTNKDERLDLEWNDFLFYKGVEIYHTHGGLTYSISEPNAPPTNTQLRELILQSYNQLKAYFKDRQTETPILPSLNDLSQERIEQTASQLQGLFLLEQE